MKYLVQSYTYKNTDLTTREKLALGDEANLRLFYQKLLDIEPILEVVILSTCNRVEIILYVSEYDDIKSKIEDLFVEQTSISKEEISKVGQTYKAQDAAYPQQLAKAHQNRQSALFPQALLDRQLQIA